MFIDINWSKEKPQKLEDTFVEKARRFVKNESQNNTWSRAYDYDTTSIEVFRAISTDSTLRQIVSHYVELTLRQGFTIKSSDNEINKRLQRRLREIEIASNSDLNLIIRRAMRDFIAYGNAYLTFKRNAKNASGKSYIFTDGSKLEPISALFPVDPYNMMIHRGKHGSLLEYRQDINLIDGKNDFTWYLDPTKEIVSLSGSGKRTNGVAVFKPNDVLHFRYDESDLAFGRSFLLEAIEDLLILRHIESVMIRLIEEGEFYVKTYKVGSPSQPGGSKQAKQAEEIISNSVSEEFLIIPGNHDIEIKEMSSLKDVMNYANYFRNRYYGSLGVSVVSMGEPGAANRATADTATDAMYDKARDFQRVFAAQFRSQFLIHLVMDMGYAPENLDNETMPKLIFPDPDVDRAIKLENEAVYLYEHEAITEDEMRNRIGMESVENRDGMYLNKVKIPLAEAQAQAKLMGFNPNETSNKINPQNQHTGGNE